MELEALGFVGDRRVVANGSWRRTAAVRHMRSLASLMEHDHDVRATARQRGDEEVASSLRATVREELLPWLSEQAQQDQQPKVPQEGLLLDLEERRSCGDVVDTTLAPAPCPESSSCPSDGFDLDLLGGQQKWSPLHLAGHTSHHASVALLLSARANPLVRNLSNKTPRWVARGNFATQKILRLAEEEWVGSTRRSFEEVGGAAVGGRSERRISELEARAFRERVLVLVEPTFRKQEFRGETRPPRKTRSDHSEICTFMARLRGFLQQDRTANALSILQLLACTPDEVLGENVLGEAMLEMARSRRLSGAGLAAVVEWLFSRRKVLAVADLVFCRDPAGNLLHVLLETAEQRVSSAVADFAATVEKLRNNGANLGAGGERDHVGVVSSSTNGSAEKKDPSFQTEANGEDVTTERGSQTSVVPARLSNTSSPTKKVNKNNVVRNNPWRKERVGGRISNTDHSAGAASKGSASGNENDLPAEEPPYSSGLFSAVDDLWTLFGLFDFLLRQAERSSAAGTTSSTGNLDDARSPSGQTLLQRSLLLCARTATTAGAAFAPGPTQNRDLHATARTGALLVAEQADLAALGFVRLFLQKSSSGSLRCPSRGSPNAVEPTAGWTALHFAVQKGLTLAVQGLLESVQSVDINLGDRILGWSPLAEAAIRADLRSLLLLMRAGAASRACSSGQDQGEMNFIASALHSAGREVSAEDKRLVLAVAAANGYWTAPDDHVDIASVAVEHVAVEPSHVRRFLAESGDYWKAQQRSSTFGRSSKPHIPAFLGEASWSWSRRQAAWRRGGRENIGSTLRGQRTARLSGRGRSAGGDGGLKMCEGCGLLFPEEMLLSCCISSDEDDEHAKDVGGVFRNVLGALLSTVRKPPQDLCRECRLFVVWGRGGHAVGGNK